MSQAEFDPLSALAEIIKAPNNTRSHGIETAQISAAELLLDSMGVEDVELEAVAAEFIRKIARGGGEGSVTNRLAAIRAMINRGLS